MNQHVKDIYAEFAEKVGCSPVEARRHLFSMAYGGRMHFVMTPLRQVAEFHAKFELPGLEQPEPRQLTDEEALFRINFMLEELGEYAECSGFVALGVYLKEICSDIKEHMSNKVSIDICERTSDRDFHGQLDALVDLSYVLHGTALFHGLKRFDEAFAEVHRVNMTKVRATSEDQSKRGTKLDVVKPPGFQPPNLEEFLK